MSKISNVLSELGVSKVRLAKYLGVSRQMLYNYLATENLEDWPSEKATRLMQLLEIKSEDDLNNLVIDGDYIIKIDNKLNEGVKVALSGNSLVDLKGFNRKEVEVLTDITTLLKDRLKDDKTKDTYNTFVYLYHFLQSMETNKEFKYLLAFICKLTGFTNPREFLYNQEQQITFETIMYSGFTLYSKNVDFDKYDEFLNLQTRYSNLKKVNPLEADKLLKENKDNAIERYNYYVGLQEVDN